MIELKKRSCEFLNMISVQSYNLVKIYSCNKIHVKMLHCMENKKIDIYGNFLMLVISLKKINKHPRQRVTCIYKKLNKYLHSSAIILF